MKIQFSKRGNNWLKFPTIPNKRKVDFPAIVLTVQFNLYVMKSESCLCVNTTKKLLCGGFPCWNFTNSVCQPVTGNMLL